MVPTPSMYNVWEVERCVDELEAILRTLGIHIQCGSPFEDEYLQVRESREIAESGVGWSADTDLRSGARRVVALRHIVVKLLRQHAADNLEPFIPHLRLLSSAQLGQGEAKTMPGSDSDKLFELFVGLCCAEFGTDVVLDSPVASKGDNPDVLVTSCGKRWGLACKVPHSKKAESIRDMLEKGVGQVEASDAECGAVVFNLRNLFDHDKALPRIDGPDGGYGCVEDPRKMDAIVMSFAHDWVQPMVDLVTYDWLEELFHGKKAVRGAIGYIETAAGVLRHGRPVITGCAYALRRGFSRHDIVIEYQTLSSLMSEMVSR